MSLAGGSSPLEWGTGEAKIEMSSEFDQKNTRKKNPLRIIWYEDDNTGSEDCSALIFGVKKNTTEKYYYVTLLLLYAAFPASLLLATARDRMQGEMDYWSWSGTAIPISALKQNLTKQQFWVWLKTLHGSIEHHQLLGEF